MKIVAVTNEKGGVGKTTTTLTLGAALVELGYRVALIGLDPQRDLTTFAPTMQTADFVFYDADSKTLRRAIKCARSWGANFVLLDCPPALGTEVTTSLIVCDMAIIPAQPEGLSVLAMQRMIETLEAAQQSHRRTAPLDWRLLITMFSSSHAATAIENHYRNELGARVLDGHINRHDAFNDVALEFGCVLSIPRIQPAAQYRRVARELAQGWPQLEN